MMAFPFQQGVALLASMLSIGHALAHGGGLNAEGCHSNRKTGDYHCHRAPAIATAKQPQQLAAAAQPASAPSYSGAPTCYTGPRGGTYTLTKSGKKNYGGC